MSPFVLPPSFTIAAKPTRPHVMSAVGAIGYHVKLTLSTATAAQCYYPPRRDSFSGFLSGKPPLSSPSSSSTPTSASFPSLQLNGGGSRWRKVTAASASLPVPEDTFSDDGTGGEEAAEEEQQRREKGIQEMVGVAAMIAIWYLLNIYFNIFNKQVLKMYPFPFTVSTIQFAVCTAIICLMWACNLHPLPRLSYSQVAAIVPLAMMHTLGNFLTNVSFGKVAISFTHTIKAMEPFFSVMLATIFLGETPSVLVVASLLPIASGVALASFTEVSFNWIGFWSAMASNLTNQSRNVISKKFMVDRAEENLDNVNLFAIMTVMSFLTSIPLTIFIEGVRFTPSYFQNAGLNMKYIYIRSLLAGLCFYSYQQVSYMLLGRMSPITHSVANSVKRVAVIVSSILFFRTPISIVNSIGTAMALTGVFCYSRAKKAKSKSV